MERTEMRMLGFIILISLKDKIGNEVIRKTLELAFITDKIREGRFRWHQAQPCEEKRRLKLH